MSRLPHIDWPWSQVHRYLTGRSCLDRCSSGHTYSRWCLLRIRPDGPWYAPKETTLYEHKPKDRPKGYPLREPDGHVVGFVGYETGQAPLGWEWVGTGMSGHFTPAKGWSEGGIITSGKQMTPEEAAAFERRWATNDARPSGVLSVLPATPSTRVRWWGWRTFCGAQRDPAGIGLLPYVCDRRRWHVGDHTTTVNGEEVARWPRG